MKKINLAFIFLGIFLCISIFGNESNQKKEIKPDAYEFYAAEMQDFLEREGNVKEKDYNSLCMLGLFHLGEAIRKKDAENTGYEKDISKSIEYFSKAVNKDKDLTSAYKGLFSVYYFIGNAQKALNNIQQAIAKDKNDFEAVFMLGNFYYEEGNLPEAARSYMFVTILFEDEMVPELMIKAARIWIELGERGNAESVIEEFRGRFPNHPLRAQAEALLGTSDSEESKPQGEA